MTVRVNRSETDRTSRFWHLGPVVPRVIPPRYITEMSGFLKAVEKITKTTDFFRRISVSIIMSDSHVYKDVLAVTTVNGVGAAYGIMGSFVAYKYDV